jgi:hypothetical protein
MASTVPNHHTGGKKGAPKPHQLLRDLRAVYNQAAPVKDDEPGRVMLWEIRKKDAAKFVKMVQDEEAKFAEILARNRTGADAPAAAVKEEVVRDAGTVRALELTRRLLKEFHDGKNGQGPGR